MSTFFDIKYHTRYVLTLNIQWLSRDQWTIRVRNVIQKSISKRLIASNGKTLYFCLKRRPDRHHIYQNNSSGKIVSWPQTIFAISCFECELNNYIKNGEKKINFHNFLIVMESKTSSSFGSIDDHSLVIIDGGRF